MLNVIVTVSVNNMKKDVMQILFSEQANFGHVLKFSASHCELPELTLSYVPFTAVHNFHSSIIVCWFIVPLPALIVLHEFFDADFIRR